MVGHVVQNRHDGTQEMFVSIVSSVTVRFLRSWFVPRDRTSENCLLRGEVVTSRCHGGKVSA